MTAEPSRFPTPQAPTPIWRSGDPEPRVPIGFLVADREGDVWELVSDGWVLRRSDEDPGPHPWSYVVSEFGPVTESGYADESETR